MSKPGQAVFLSYASQDAEAARRLCDALRAAGVEVWFDADGGLEHGDEWDAKIRRQIKECVLFIAVISANTQAREEGYFRIEWDLAAERARGIASGVAFILPVVIDGTREPDALVPDRFRSVQWTKIPGGTIPPEVLQRFLKLWSHRTGVLKQAVVGASLDDARGRAQGAPLPARPSATLRNGLAVLALLVLAGAAYLVFKPRRSAEDIARIVADAQQLAAAAQPPKAAPAAEYPRDPELRRARQLLYTMDAIPEDFRLAEDILKPVLARQPNDPDTATTAAEVALEFGIRGFDLTQARRTQAQRLTERAAQLAPDNPYALAALARNLLFNNAQLGRAEELIRHAIDLRPDEARFHRTFYSILSVNKPVEADGQAARMAAQFPRDPLIPYDIARRYKDDNDLAQAEQWFDRTLALPTPPAFALIWKAWIMAWIHGDLAGMKQWLDRVPDRQRANARVANARYVHGLFSGDTGHALQALGEVSDDWLTDFDFTGPKSLLVGFLRQRSGQADLARVQFEVALAAANAEIDKNPTDFRPQRAKLWALIGLGRLEEARALQRILLQATPRPYVLNFRSLGWTNTVTSCLLLGLRAEAVDLLRETCTDANSRLVLRNLFLLDPRLAPWRDDREIAALLNPPAAGAAGPLAPVANDKSVAVLPFANLSGDKEQEYFSDGLTEEILNTLARERDLRVPGRASAFSFKGKNVSSAEIAKALNVSRLVEGSVRKSGNKVRISVSLTRAADGFSEELGTFTEEMTDIFALQDKVARAVVEKLTKRTVTSVAVGLTKNAEAYDAYLKGRALQTRAANNALEAAKFYEQAVALDPAFALAWARLAEARFRSYGGQSDRSPEVVKGARYAIDQALAAQPDLPEALIMRANWTRSVEYGYPAAQRDLERAEALQPAKADLRYAQAMLARDQGNLPEAFRRYREALQLDPQNGDYTNAFAVGLCLPRGEYVEADQLFWRAMAIQGPGVATPFTNLIHLRSLWRGPEAALRLLDRMPATQAGLDDRRVSLLVSLGRLDEARAVADQLASMASPAGSVALLASQNQRPEPALLLALGREEQARQRAKEILADTTRELARGNRAPLVRTAFIRAEILLGHRDSALAALREWREEAQRMPSDYRRLSEFTSTASALYALLGQADEAVALMRELKANGYIARYGLRHNPDFAPIRSDPRFQEIERQYEAWRKTLPDPVDL